MDSLELPFDLIWEGKPEPLSPSQFALANAEDVLIFDNDFDNDLILDDDDFSKRYIAADEKRLSAYQLLLELQHSIVNDSDSADAADQWLDQTINFQPLTVYIAPASLRTVQQPLQPVKVEQTAQLLREFDSVFDAVELTHLTPPQTPPESPPIVDYTDDPKQHEFVYTIASIEERPIPTARAAVVAPQQQSNYFGGYDVNVPAASPYTFSQDIAHEMEVVEELVRARAENLPDWTDDDEEDDKSNSSSSSSKHQHHINDDDDDDDSNSISASSSSASCSPRSDSSYSYSNDDEWSSRAINSSSEASPDVGGKATKRRIRPYGRSSEDKKSRKKEQNKNAATRYRKKKKAEIEIAMDEERELQDIHAGLEVKCADVQREIKCLKSLMRDLYKAKGLM